MRVIAIIALLLMALPSATVFAEEGEYCVIPKLVQGQPTVVDVPNIDKPFCGMALIDRHYVRLSEFSKAHEESPVTCRTDAFCIKIFRYYLDEERQTEPYIIIFQGPKKPNSA